MELLDNVVSLNTQYFYTTVAYRYGWEIGNASLDGDYASVLTRLVNTIQTLLIERLHI
jgi:hypothetical protein